MSSHRITCLVPTHDRPAFLRRWFRFYQQFPPGFAVTVVDSSGPAAAAENAALIRTGARGIDTEYLHLDLDLMTKCQSALERTTTPFVTLCADDDLAFPDAVARSADFLEQQPGYCSAQGRTAKVYPNRRWFGRVRLKGFSIEDDDPLERCRRLAGNFFTNYYAVYRTAELRENFRIGAVHTDSRSTYALAEMMLSQLSAIRGRIKVLPFMHLVLERHPAMAGVLSRGRQWSEPTAQYQRFRSGLVQELAKVGTDPDEAGAYLDGQFVHFRDPGLLHRQRRSSLADALRHNLSSLRERIEDHFRPGDVRHRRPILPSDIAGSEAQWRAALSLMDAHPDGIAIAKPDPADPGHRHD